MACIDDERQMGYENRNGQGEQVTMSILDCTAVELSEKIKAGTCTAMEAMEAVFERIGEKEEEHHCYITADRKSALKRAAAVQAKIEKGELTGALAGVPVAVTMPRICTDRELPQLEKELAALGELGVTEALAGTWGMVRRAWQLGFSVRGDYGLGVYNSQAMKELRRLGLLSATLSFELKFPQMRDISKAIPAEFIAYGRLPLMITETCIIHNHCGRHTCNNVNLLTDRKGERFPVVKAWGCRNEILNSKKLFLADKQKDWQKLGLWGARLMFTTENALECAQVLERYMNQGKYQPNDFTRGLYYRDVE